jgi:putative nucleotidyltransferase with HDIG domain
VRAPADLAPPSDPALDQALADVVARGAVELPPYPAVALQIDRLVRGGDYGIDALARLVSSDQALAADLLRLANTAAYARGAPVAALRPALTRVGADALARVALASSVGALAQARGPLAPLRRRVWQDALSAAFLARELARARGLPAEDAFTCGLLHDVGKVVALAGLERLAGGAQGRPRPAHVWERVAERHHVVLGTALAARWELPAVVADAIAYHHDHSDLAAAPEIVRVLAVIDPVVRLLGDRDHLDVSEASALASLTDPECDALARTIDLLPGIVAAFEREALPEPSPMLERPPAPAVCEAAPGVRFRIGGAEHAARGFAAHQLVLSGPVPLPEGTLVECAPAAAPGATFHARVLASWPETAGYGSVLAPFALSGPALTHWQALAKPRA